MKKIVIAVCLLLLIAALLFFAHCYYQTLNMPVPIYSRPCGYGIDENGNYYKWFPTAGEIKEIEICP